MQNIYWTHNQPIIKYKNETPNENKTYIIKREYSRPNDKRRKTMLSSLSISKVSISSPNQDEQNKIESKKLLHQSVKVTRPSKRE